jgi:HipA-like protein
VGRKRQGRALDVYVGTSKVGRYTRAPDGATAFRYDPDWLVSDRSFPISLSMPLSDRVWSGEGATSYFDGLLPDDRTVREKIAAREHAESAGIFDLLAVIGRDCVGALRFVPEGTAPGDPTRMDYRPVSADEIAARLAALGTNPLGLYANEDDFRISIAGVQEKTAFLWIDEQWQLPLGPTPTSHIFKPAMREGPNGADFSDTPWNEWLCLTLCRALGLETARTEVQLVDGKPVIVVERFDRIWQELRRQTSVGLGWGSTSATGFRGFAVRCCLESSPHAFGSYKGAVLPGEGSRGNCGGGSKEWRCRVCRRAHELANALVGIEGGEGGGELVWRATEERNVIRVWQVEGQHCSSGQVLEVLGKLRATGAATFAMLDVVV